MNKKDYHIFLDVIATIIIAIAVLTTVIIGYNYLKFPSPKIQTIKIEYHGVKTDSINELNKIEIRKLDLLLKDIKITSNKIQQQQLEVVEKKSDDSFYNKFYTAVVAIILALAGFFGFKSISEIKTQAIDDAKNESTKIAKKESKKIAKEEFIRMFDTKYKAGVYEQANQAMNDFLRSEIGSLEDRITVLEEFIKNDGNGNSQNEVEPDNDNPVVPDGVLTEDNLHEEDVQADKNNLVEPENPFDNE